MKIKVRVPNESPTIALGPEVWIEFFGDLRQCWNLAFEAKRINRKGRPFGRPFDVLLV
ncbi:UNVERIFIED_ORG: hypothetical protein J2W85_007083 [Ensifer adhaerens]|nr:hypothetical protein [Ensifer adhaerens]